LIRERNFGQRRRRRWDQVSWWYSLILVAPIIGFIATFLWSSSGDDSGLRGVVRDAYTGEPVSGAVVSTANSTATTNGDGKFSLDDLAATQLDVTRDEYAATQVAIASVEDELEIALRPTTIRGVVKNKKTGDPLAGVVVTATGPNGEVISSTTDDDGKYELVNVPDGSRIAVAYEGFTVDSKPLGTNVQLDFEIRPDRLTGKITDANGQPIAGAVVSIGAATATTGPDGTYSLAAVPESGTITVRKAGYSDQTGELSDSLTFDAQLQEFKVNAIYVNASTAGSDELWENMLDIADNTEVNAIVLDLKDSTGKVFYDSHVPMASQIGALSPVFDVNQRLEEMQERDLYTIARIVVFEDPLLAGARPDVALKDSTGGVWTTWNGSAWVNAHNREVWQYNIDIATEAAEFGFDEIQVDYIRFPTDGDLNIVDYGAEFASESRLDATTGFLTQMQAALKPTGSLLAVDIFGQAMWNDDDGDIGQNFRAFAPLVDIVCPMIYPSHFYPGEFAFDIPNNHPYEVIQKSLQHGAEMVPEGADKLRPWLQDFSYGEGIEYGDTEVAAQIQAAKDFGANGWMLWSPDNSYHVGGIAP
jgi:hypothetical protein